MKDDRDEHDWLILKAVNEKFKFAVPLFDCPATIGEEAAFHRGLENDWYRLFDVSRLTPESSMTYRIFRLTTEGKVRHAYLKAKFPPTDKEVSK